MAIAPMTSCTSCGGPRNHYLDGALQPKCSKCNDLASALKPNRAVGSVNASRSFPALTREAAGLLQQIDDLLDDSQYEFAHETLEGIKGTVQRTGRCTERQEIAVMNIADAGGRDRDR
jgi:hypothetical protein